ALRVGGNAVLADAEVEHAVGSEVDGAAVVVGGTELRQVEQTELAARPAAVAASGEAAEAVVQRGLDRRVVDVDPRRAREVGVQRDAEQAALPLRVDV